MAKSLDLPYSEDGISVNNSTTTVRKGLGTLGTAALLAFGLLGAGGIGFVLGDGKPTVTDVINKIMDYDVETRIVPPK